MASTHPSRRRAAPFLAGFIGLAACGGGGGDGDGGANGPDPDPGGAGTLGSYFVSSFAAFEAAAANLRDNVSRYTVQSGSIPLPDNPNVPGDDGGTYVSYPLASSRVDYAHAVGLTGRGQVISIIDDGFRRSHAAFAGKSNSSTGTIQTEDHGTAVASVAAGNSSTMIGVAPGADLHFGDWSGSNLAAATNQARALGAVAQNNSWGFVDGTGNTLQVSTDSFDLIFANPTGQAYLAALDAYAAEGVVVFAVSNNPDEPAAGLMEALPLLRPSLEEGWIAVANAVPDFDNAGINSANLVSAGCLEAAQWCMVADGFWYAANADTNSSYDQVVGSSFAAPQVAGAMALLAEAFPALTPHDLRIRLLASANNQFANFNAAGTMDLLPGPEEFLHDYSTQFGHGFLDLRAALLPIGTPVLTMAGGDTIAVKDAAFTTGAAFGDAVQQSLAGIDLAVADSLAGAFKMPGASLAGTAAPVPLGDGLLARTMASDLTRTRTAAVAAPRPTFADHAGRTLDLVDAETGLRASLLVPQDGSAADGYGFAFTQPLTTGPLQVDVGVKVAQDDGSLLGFGGDDGGAGLASVGVTVSRAFDGGGFLALQAEMGVAEVGSPDAFSDVSDVGFDSYGVTVGHRDVFARGDRLALGVSMPTAVTSGAGRVDLAVATAEGGREVRSVGIDLAPSERQVDVSIGYQVPVGARSELLFEVVHAQNWGNVAGREDTAGVVGFTFRF